ncbi:MAG: aminomethyl-transferring glycine dehydrogenase subunit GcvPA [bacterium]
MFTPLTDEERSELLRAIGVKTFEDLISDIPEELRFKGFLRIGKPMSEPEVKRYFKSISDLNLDCNHWISFLGAGAYDHYIPSIVDSIVSRSEFYTAYTPYQPEISQGTLQTIYEYQSLICRLTGMEVSNASLYDGATAMAEAVLMATGITGKRRVVISGCIHPHRMDVLKTYLLSAGFELVISDRRDGITRADQVSNLLKQGACAMVIENPNFFGCVENLSEIVELAHRNGALAICSVDPISLGLLKPPGDFGVDIVTGEGQSLGIPLSYGGPYLGFLATRKEFIRRLPGRIVGRTNDSRGRECFCLTLQTREQHIRRQRATSNICTNQALMALRALVYLCWLGPQGISEVARQCFFKAVYAERKFASVGIKRRFEHPFFKEFAIVIDKDVEEALNALKKRRLLGGIPLKRFYADESQSVLVAFTEKRTHAEIELLVDSFKEVLS